MSRAISLLLLAGAAFSQVKPANPGFEQGELGSVPTGWSAPDVATRVGFGVALVDQHCRTGRCAMMTGVADPPENLFGNLMQSIPAGGYQLRHIRLRGAMRVEGPATRAHMWLRIDRADNSMAFLDNMSQRPVTSPDWKTYEIETDVPSGASRLVFGFTLFGGGTAWVDDFSLDTLDEIHKDRIEQPRSVTGQGLTNLTAFARLYGYVRFFHPSDQAASTDWETFAVDGARQVEDAESTAELMVRLRKIFGEVAPTVQIYPPGEAAAPAPAAGRNFIRYQHHGVGLSNSTMTRSTYKSERVKKSAASEPPPRPFHAELARGVMASVPLALEVDSDGTLRSRHRSDQGSESMEIIVYGTKEKS